VEDIIIHTKQGSTQKRFPKNSRRGKTKHSDWNAQEKSASDSLNPMANGAAVEL
jgi:hypothetical protein